MNRGLGLQVCEECGRIVSYDEKLYNNRQGLHICADCMELLYD